MSFRGAAASARRVHALFEADLSILFFSMLLMPSFNLMLNFFLIGKC